MYAPALLTSPLPFLTHHCIRKLTKDNDKDENEALTKQHEVFHVLIRRAEYHEYPTRIWLARRRDASSRAQEIRGEIEVPTL